MKSLLLFILGLLYSFSISTAQVSDFHFNTGFITDMTVKNGIVAVLGGKTIFDENTGKSKNLATVGIKKNGVWQNLPLTIDRNGKLDSFYIWAHSKIQIDSKNNIWVTGLNGLYKYDGSKWSEYFIDDEFKEERRYNLFLISKNDIFYISTSVSRMTKEPIRFSELLTFNSDSFVVKETRNSDVAYLTNSWPVKNNNFVELNDGSILLAHNPHKTILPDSSSLNFDISKINKDWSFEYYTMMTFDSIISQKTPTNVIQHTDGSIWFSHFGGTYGKLVNGEIESHYCCWGVAYTSNLIQYKFLGYEYGFKDQYYPYSTYSISEMPNGNLLVASMLKRITFQVVNIVDKSLRSVDNRNFYENSLLIPANDYPTWQQFYHNIVDTLRRDLAEQAGYIGNFQSIHFDNEGTMYLNFLGFLLEIPVNNITSVDAGVEITDALRVFPNPAETTIKIDCRKEIRSVTATNILGSEALLNSKGNNSFGISNLSTGLYTLLILHLDGSVSRTFFVKK